MTTPIRPSLSQILNTPSERPISRAQGLQGQDRLGQNQAVLPNGANSSSKSAFFKALNGSTNTGNGATPQAQSATPAAPNRPSFLSLEPKITPPTYRASDIERATQMRTDALAQGTEPAPQKPLRPGSFLNIVI